MFNNLNAQTSIQSKNWWKTYLLVNILLVISIGLPIILFGPLLDLQVKGSQKALGFDPVLNTLGICALLVILTNAVISQIFKIPWLLGSVLGLTSFAIFGILFFVAGIATDGVPYDHRTDWVWVVVILFSLGLAIASSLINAWMYKSTKID